MRVCVVGAGSSGLSATKACLEAGLTPVCFEAREDGVGGRWRDGSGINVWSKEMSAFSDFPPPPHQPTFGNGPATVEYLEQYAETFGLNVCVRLGHRVKEVVPHGKEWRVKVLGTRMAMQTTEELFDAVLVCSGRHAHPLTPHIPGQENFEGPMRHSHNLTALERFQGKSVLVVGAGNSGVDLACKLAGKASKVFLSTRRGTWVLPRTDAHGQPLDMTFLRRGMSWLWGPAEDMLCRGAEWWLNHRHLDHSAFTLKPCHRLSAQYPTISDDLRGHLVSGAVAVKGAVARLEASGAVFEGEDSVTAVDAVVLATGYRVNFPFLDSKLIAVEHNHLNLYKLVFPPHLSPPSLAFIGLADPVGPRPPVAELQARWAVQVLAGRLTLPSTRDMWTEAADRKLQSSERYYASPRHTLAVPWVSYLEDLAGLLGVLPPWSLAALWVPCLPYFYRLKGPHAWSGAQRAIENATTRVTHPYRTRTIVIPPPSRHPTPVNFFRLFLLLVVLIGFLLWTL